MRELVDRDRSRISYTFLWSPANKKPASFLRFLVFWLQTFINVPPAPKRRRVSRRLFHDLSRWAPKLQVLNLFLCMEIYYNCATYAYHLPLVPFLLLKWHFLLWYNYYQAYLNHWHSAVTINTASIFSFITSSDLDTEELLASQAAVRLGQFHDALARCQHLWRYSLVRLVMLIKLWHYSQSQLQYFLSSNSINFNC